MLAEPLTVDMGQTQRLLSTTGRLKNTITFLEQQHEGGGAGGVKSPVPTLDKQSP